MLSPLTSLFFNTKKKDFVFAWTRFGEEMFRCIPHILTWHC